MSDIRPAELVVVIEVTFVEFVPHKGELALSLVEKPRLVHAIGNPEVRDWAENQRDATLNLWFR